MNCKPLFSLTFLGLMSVVYFIYMFSQTAYFFSAFSGILPEGYTFTFADYARRGFFETEAIAFINLAIMSLFLLLTQRGNSGKLNGVLKGFMTFISAFTVLLIATAVSKMAMYINIYSLTRLRLFTTVFMLATAAVIVAFAVYIYKSHLHSMKYAVLISLVLFTAL